MAVPCKNTHRSRRARRCGAVVTEYRDHAQRLDQPAVGILQPQGASIETDDAPERCGAASRNSPPSAALWPGSMGRAVQTCNTSAMEIARRLARTRWREFGAHRRSGRRSASPRRRCAGPWGVGRAGGCTARRACTPRATRRPKQNTVRCTAAISVASRAPPPHNLHAHRILRGRGTPLRPARPHRRAKSSMHPVSGSRRLRIARSRAAAIPHCGVLLCIDRATRRSPQHAHAFSHVRGRVSTLAQGPVPCRQRPTRDVERLPRGTQGRS